MPVIKETTYLGLFTRRKEVKPGSGSQLQGGKENIIRDLMDGNKIIVFDPLLPDGYQRLQKEEINKAELGRTRLKGKIETVYRWVPNSEADAHAGTRALMQAELKKLLDREPPK
jgi:hypothetical protein